MSDNGACGRCGLHIVGDAAFMCSTCGALICHRCAKLDRFQCAKCVHAPLDEDDEEEITERTVRYTGSTIDGKRWSVVDAEIMQQILGRSL